MFNRSERLAEIAGTGYSQGLAAARGLNKSQVGAISGDRGHWINAETPRVPRLFGYNQGLPAATRVKQVASWRYLYFR